MLTLIEGLPENVIGVLAEGTVSSEDYDTVLIPALEEKLKTHEKVRILYQLGVGFSGYTAGAMWEDTRVGIRHLSAFEKIAVVSDVNWVSTGVKAFAWMIPCPVKIYSNDSLQDAKTWIGE